MTKLSILNKARKEYYAGKGSKLSDTEFDALERLVAPNEKRVGAAPVKNKVRLPLPLGSLDKIKPDGSTLDWLGKQDGTITISDKIDGVSAMVVFEKDERKMYSRGNGSMGQDITQLLDHIRGVGKSFKVGTAIRGELVMKGKHFAKYRKQFANPRNLVSGIVNSKSVHKAASSITLIIHEVMRPKSKFFKNIAMLKRAGWIPAPAVQFPARTLTEEKLVAILKKRKASAKYEIDGLVLESVSSKIAFKGADVMEAAEVDHIEWTASQYGLLKPVIILKKGVNLDGVTINRVTAHNAKTVKELGIGPGAVIGIVRSGQVIPKIVKVYKKGRDGLPKGKRVWRGVDLVAPKSAETEQTVRTKRLSRFLSVIGVENVGGGLCDTLVSGGIDRISLLVHAKPQALAELIGENRGPRLASDIQKSLAKASHSMLMKASGIFGIGFGETKLDKIMEYIPWSKMSTMQEEQLGNRVAAISGFSAETAAEFAAKIPAYSKWLKLVGVKVREAKISKGKLSGKSFIFTGFRDKNAEVNIKKQGGRIANSVSKDTILVALDVKAKSTKLNKARSLGIVIITPNQLERML